MQYSGHKPHLALNNGALHGDESARFRDVQEYACEKTLSFSRQHETDTRYHFMRLADNFHRS